MKLDVSKPAVLLGILLVHTKFVKSLPTPIFESSFLNQQRTEAPIGGEFETNEASLVGVIALAVLALVTVLGNILLLLCIYAEKLLRTPTNNFVASLTIACLLGGAILMPATAYCQIAGTENVSPILFMVACEIKLLVDFIVTVVITCSIMAICAVRYLAVCYPLVYTRRHHSKISYWLPITFWALSFLSASLRALQTATDDKVIATRISTRICVAGGSTDSLPWLVVISAIVFLSGNVAAVVILCLVKQSMINRSRKVVEKLYSLAAKDSNFASQTSLALRRMTGVQINEEKGEEEVPVPNSPVTEKKWLLGAAVDEPSQSPNYQRRISQSHSLVIHRPMLSCQNNILRPLSAEAIRAMDQPLRAISSATSLIMIRQAAREQLAMPIVASFHGSCGSGLSNPKGNINQRCKKKLLSNRSSLASSSTNKTFSSITYPARSRATSMSAISCVLERIMENAMTHGFKGTVTLVALIFLFGLCYLPYVASTVVTYLCLVWFDNSCVPSRVLQIAKWMSFVYHALNAVIYFAVNKQLRTGLCRCFSKPPPMNAQLFPRNFSYNCTLRNSS